MSELKIENNNNKIVRFGINDNGNIKLIKKLENSKG